MSDTDLQLEDLEEVALGSARGGAKRSPLGPLMIEVVRGLGAQDLPALTGGLPVEDSPATTGATAPTLLQIRHQHHQLAQLLAKGSSNAEAALISGYSPTYISILKNDPTFGELLKHYAGVHEAVYVDVLERMKGLGLSTLEELQSRLAEEPEKFTKSELMQMTEMLLIKGGKAQMTGGGGTSGSGGAGISLNIKFVQAEPPAQVLIDGNIEELGE